MRIDTIVEPGARRLGHKVRCTQGRRHLRAAIRAWLLGAFFAFGSGAATAQSVQYWDCAGEIGGVMSRAVLELTTGGRWIDGPPVAGEIRNAMTTYTFNGRLFGGVEGYVLLVDGRTGQRIDRVWIGLNPSGFVLRTEAGFTYAFSEQLRLVELAPSCWSRTW